MNTLKDFVNWKLTHADKVAEAEGYPLTMENCKKNKRMKQLEIYGNSVQDGTPSPENPIEVQSVGEMSVNIFDNTKLQKFTVWNVLKAETTETGVLLTFEKTGNGSSGSTQGYYYLNMGLALQYAGKTLMLSSIDYYSPYTQLMIVTPTNTMIKEGSLSKEKDGLYYSTLSIEEDTYTDELLIARLYFNIKDSTKNSIEFRNLMLAESSTPLPYEPYGKYKIPIVVKTDTETITTNIFLDEPLRKLGDYADYIDYKENKLHRQLYEYYIDGTQTISRYNDNTMLVRTNGAKCKSIWNYGKSNRFPTGSYGQTNEVPYIGHASNNNNIVQISNCLKIEGVTDAVSLKEWFKTHHTTWIQALTTPTEETIDCDLPKLNAKTTIIEVDTSLAPSNIYGKYIKI